MAVTIWDVAKKAGVAISTVSKVMNNSSSIATATRERVHAAMEELNYIPNHLARSFVQQRANTIGVLMEMAREQAYSNPYNYELLNGLEEACHQRSQIFTLFNSNRLRSDPRAFEQLIRDKRVDGLIVHGASMTQALLEILDKLEFPYITLGEPVFPCRGPSLDVDNHLAGRLALRHLLDQGYQAPGFLGGPQEDSISQGRLTGFVRELEDSGLSPRGDRILHTVSGQPQGQDCLERLEASGVDSLVCSSNFLAFGALQAWQSRGLSLPRDRGLVGFDTYPFAPWTQPGMTTVEVDLFDYGFQAGQALFQLLDFTGQEPGGMAPGGSAFPDGLSTTIPAFRLVPRGSAERQN